MTSIVVDLAVRAIAWIELHRRPMHCDCPESESQRVCVVCSTELDLNLDLDLGIVYILALMCT